MKRLIEIFGSGCTKCHALTQSAEQVAEKLGWDVEVKHITDLNIIADRGIFNTPALAVDGNIIVSGRYLPPDKLEKIFIEQE